MRIAYGRKVTQPLLRIDGIIIKDTELLTANGLVAFRGDNRKPSEIFPTGFKPRDNNYKIDCAYSVDDANTWDKILNEYAKTHPGGKSDPKFPSKTCTLASNEICFRPNYMDLQQETCISLTLDPALAAGFPLNKEAITYLYAVKLRNRYLETFEVQKAAGSRLSDSKEITALEVPPDDVIGAAVIQRAVQGESAMAKIHYNITLWVDNPLHPGNASKKRGKTIDESIFNFTGHKLSLSGDKNVSPGQKDTAHALSSNEVLENAIKALCAKTNIVVAGKRTEKTTDKKIKKIVESPI